MERVPIRGRVVLSRRTLLLIGAIYVPAYAVAAALLVRSGLFNFSPRPFTNDETKALWAFAGVVVTSSATLIGVLTTQAQNSRAEARLRLDTVVNSLGLLSSGDSRHAYSPKAVVSGALTTLVHLEHSTIAVRALGPAWRDGAVDAATATWIIGEVFSVGDAEAHLDAAFLLRERASDLCGSAPGDFNWPQVALDEWPILKSHDARLAVLEALLKMALSRPIEWWRSSGTTGYIVVTLYEALLTDPSGHVKATAANALERMMHIFPADAGFSSKAHGDRQIRPEEIRQTISDTPGKQLSAIAIGSLLRQLPAWSSGPD